ncbi:uncharacterized protein EAF01_008643 [Botrytis porri]|uniref:uncharacterized protein n=1 Tax=Botrytis porri TaxID=87229 RepID=UPI0018FFA653|nr:uncharacterized protein EAF01_008643 [Botrytis porri]KAF7897677.1 hypothetical protein EAF01_008643 [Botrytis porri]
MCTAARLDLGLPSSFDVHLSRRAEWNSSLEADIFWHYHPEKRNIYLHALHQSSMEDPENPDFIGAQLPPVGGERHPDLQVGKRAFIIMQMNTTITFIGARRTNTINIVLRDDPDCGTGLHFVDPTNLTRVVAAISQKDHLIIASPCWGLVRRTQIQITFFLPPKSYELHVVTDKGGVCTCVSV